MSLLLMQVSKTEFEAQLNCANIGAEGMAISKPILEQTLPEYKKQMSVNGMGSSIFEINHLLICHS